MIAIAGARPFADLFANRADLAKVLHSFTASIEASFAGDGAMRKPTADEVKRRFAICERWFRDLRGTKLWSIDRCLAAVPQALKAELSGQTYEPDSRSLWIPQDGK